MSVTWQSTRAVDRIKSDASAAVILHKLQHAMAVDPPWCRPFLCRAIEGVEALLAGGLSPSEMQVGMAAVRGKFERGMMGL